jgi:hypothetical protein
MGFLDKAKAAAEQATTKAKEGVDDVQTKRELTQAYGELGKSAFGLAKKGELSHPELSAQVENIRALEARLGSDAAAPATTGEPPAASA